MALGWVHGLATCSKIATCSNLKNNLIQPWTTYQFELIKVVCIFSLYLYFDEQLS